MGTINVTRSAGRMTVTEDKTNDRLQPGDASPSAVISTNAVTASDQGAGATSGKRWVLVNGGWNLQ